QPNFTPNMVAFGVRPAWQPGNGLLVLYDGCNNGDVCDSLYTENPFTPDPKNPTHVVHCTNPACSPTGAQIACQDNDDTGNVNIFLVNHDGTNKTQLTQGAGNSGNPIWSADGQWTFYRTDQTG